jgi:hypothetical protein
MAVGPLSNFRQPFEKAEIRERNQGSPFATLGITAKDAAGRSEEMKPRSRTRSLPTRPDLVYAGTIALIICAGLIARGFGILPIQ